MFVSLITVFSQSNIIVWPHTKVQVLVKLPANIYSFYKSKKLDTLHSKVEGKMPSCLLVCYQQTKILILMTTVATKKDGNLGGGGECFFVANFFTLFSLF